MKNIKIIILRPVAIFLSICILFTSCHTTQTITINAPSGTKIYTPSKVLLGTTSNKGSVDIEIDSDIYYAYLLSKSTDSDYYVPFALDYKNKNYNLTKFGEYVGKGIAYIGCGVTSFSLLAAAILGAAGADDETTSTAGFISLGGLGALGVGMAIGMSCEARGDQTQYQYRYKYLQTQTTNCDIKFTQPNYEENLIRKENKETTIEVEKVSTTPHKEENSSIANIKLKSDKSTIKLNNHARTISGEYLGSGKLTKDDSIIEDYENIKVILKYNDKNNVDVNVMLGEENLFPMPSTYKISKTENGYNLKHSEISQAEISIDKSNNLIYIHQRVNIDNEIYTLTIKANKQ